MRRLDPIKIVAIACVLATCAGVVMSPLVPVLHRWKSERALRLLEDPDPEVRKRAAWEAIEQSDSTRTSCIDQLLPYESDPLVREAFVYTLGHVDNPDYIPTVERAVERDESGFVRAAAWVSLAQLSSDQFEQRATSGEYPRDNWDRIGIAEGKLLIGDMSGTEPLLQFAAEGNETERYLASRALFKWLRPILDAAGRWPFDADLELADIWSPEFVREIEQRCAALDLQAIADDTLSRHKNGPQADRSVKRVNGLRERLARWLFAE